MKKFIVSLMLTSAFATSLCVTGCNVSSNSSTDSDRSVIDCVDSSEGFYSYAAASVGSIISANACAEQAVSTELLTTALSAQTLKEELTKDKVQAQSEPTEEQLETINGYMTLVENLLGEGKANSVVTESDREGYEVKEVVSFSDLEGNSLSYTMYYNRTVISIETEEDDDDDRDHDDDDDRDEDKHNKKDRKNGVTPLSGELETVTKPEEGAAEEGETATQPEEGAAEEGETATQPQEQFKGEIETEYSISGIMIVDETEYALEGVYETETSRKGEESESFFKVTLSESSFIIMEQEIEDDEQSFVYGIYADGKVVESVKFSYETEKNQTELKMTVFKDGEKSELKFKDETEKNGERKITVKADIGGQKINFKIYVTTDENGNEVYRYQFGEKIKDMFKPGKNEGNGNNNDRHDEQNKPGLPIDGEEHKPAPEVPAGGEDETITDGTVTEE